MSRNDDYTTGNLFHYLHHQKYYKLIGIDLIKQTKMSIPQQILQENCKKMMVQQFFVAEKQQKTILNFSLDSLIVQGYYK